MIITIDTNTGLITINNKEKELKQATIPQVKTPIQYNYVDIKRKYFKKGDPEYHRKTSRPITKSKIILKSLGFDRIVKQEPLLDLCY